MLRARTWTLLRAVFLCDERVRRRRAAAPGAPRAPAPVAGDASSPAADLSPVPEPGWPRPRPGASRSCRASLATAHGWTKLPMPQSEQVTELLTSEAVGPIVDLDAPIDFAVAVLGSGREA